MHRDQSIHGQIYHRASRVRAQGTGPSAQGVGGSKSDLEGTKSEGRKKIHPQVTFKTVKQKALIESLTGRSVSPKTEIKRGQFSSAAKGPVNCNPALGPIELVHYHAFSSGYFCWSTTD